MKKTRKTTLTWRTLIPLGILAASCNSSSGPKPQKIGSGSASATSAPVVTSISPTSYGVLGGTNVTLTGENFSPLSIVYVGGSQCTNAVVTGSNRIDCTIASHPAAVVDVVVTTSNGPSGTLVNGFSYNAFLYASNQSGTSALTRLLIDSGTGNVTVLGTTNTPAGAYGVEIEPTNRFVYTAGVSASQIAGFKIDHSSGDLTAVTGSPFAAGAGVNGLASSKDGLCLIGSNFNGAPASAAVSSFKIDQVTGSLTLVGNYPGGTNAGGTAVDPSNRFVYVNNYGSSNISAYHIDTSTCAMTFIQNYTSNAAPDGIVIHPSGRFLYTGGANAAGNIEGFLIDQSSGALTPISDPNNPYVTSNALSGSGPVIDATGMQVYVTARGGGGAGLGKVWAFNINQLTGQLTPINALGFATNDGPNDVRIQQTGTFVFTANTESNTITVFKRDLATGNLTPGSPAYFTIGNQPGIIAITY